MTDARTTQLAAIEEQIQSGDVSIDEVRGEGMGGGSGDLTSELLVEEISIDGMCGVY